MNKVLIKTENVAATPDTDMQYIIHHVTVNDETLCYLAYPVCIQ